jgi:hypothetical protein
MKYVASIFLLVAVAAGQNPVVRTGTTGVVDLSSASATQPARKGAGAPSGPCIQGEQYFRTDAAAGQNLYFCSSADNWTQMAAGGGGNPVGATDPVNCTAGQLFFNSTEGLQKTCSASNIWTPLREVVSGAGIGVANSGSTTSVSIDTAVILSQATAQQATPWVLTPTGNSGSAYTACPTPALTAQPATGSPWVLIPDVVNEADATLNVCGQGALEMQIVVNGGLVNVRAGDLQPSLPYQILKTASVYVVIPLDTANRDGDFTIAWIPDIQGMTESYPAVLDSMMTWVRDNRFAWNIKAVIGGGDMTNGATVPHMTTARSKWDIVKNTGDLVYVPFLGNHDYDNNAPSGRLTTIFDGQFGPSYFTGKSWYGASTYPESSNANYYVKFVVGSRKIMILVMELFPRAAAVSWAQGVLNANLDHEVILATHGYLNQNGTRTLDGDTYGPTSYGITADNSGEELWNGLIKAYKNIRMVYSDHQIGGTKHARWSDVGTNGNIIHQMFTNYQDTANGGDGWLALLKFRPAKGTVEVHHYRTYAASGLGYDANFPSYSLPYEKVTPDASVIEANSPTTPFRSGTTPPARCTPKLEFFVDTDAVADKLLQCNAAGTGWDTVVGSGGGGGYGTIQEEGSGLIQRTTVNFTGAGVTCTDDAGNSRTSCSIPGGSSQTRSFSILRDAVPDSGGNVYWDLYSNTATNDRWGHGAWQFADTSTDLKLSGIFDVPSDYAANGKIYLSWSSTATAGNVRWGVAYRCISGDDTQSLDQTGQQEAVEATDAAPTLAHRRLRLALNLTAANLAAGDVCQYEIYRKGSDGVNDTMAAKAMLIGAVFEYTN